ncbi:hypothetical protein DESA109040_00110 [Deinococcus saxicola]
MPNTRRAFAWINPGIEAVLGPVPGELGADQPSLGKVAP